MTMTPMTTQLMAAVPRDRAGMGSATNDTTRELGGALGVAVLGSLLTGKFASGVESRRRRPLGPAIRERSRRRSRRRLRTRSARGLIPDGLGRPVVARQAFVDGLGLATTVSAVVVVIAAVLVYRFLPSDRDSLEVTGEGVEVEPDRRRSTPAVTRRRPRSRHELLSPPPGDGCRRPFDPRTTPRIFGPTRTPGAACRCARSASTSRAARTATARPYASATSTSLPTLRGGARTTARPTSAASPIGRGRHGSLVTPPTPDEPASVADGTAAAILDEAEDVLNAVGDQVRVEVDAERSAARRQRRWWSRFFGTRDD